MVNGRVVHHRVDAGQAPAGTPGRTGGRAASSRRRSPPRRLEVHGQAIDVAGDGRRGTGRRACSPRARGRRASAFHVSKCQCSSAIGDAVEARGERRRRRGALPFAAVAGARRGGRVTRDDPVGRVLVVAHVLVEGVRGARPGLPLLRPLRLARPCRPCGPPRGAAAAARSSRSAAGRGAGRSPGARRSRAAPFPRFARATTPTPSRGQERHHRDEAVDVAAVVHAGVAAVGLDEPAHGVARPGDLGVLARLADDHLRLVELGRPGPVRTASRRPCLRRAGAAASATCRARSS